MAVRFKENFPDNEIYCVECDGEVTCFELGKLPPLPKDPKELGIIFPCCSRNQPSEHNKRNKEKQGIMKDKRKATFKTTAGPNLNKMLSVAMPPCAKVALVYFYDDDGFKNMATFSKSDAECVNVVDLNADKAAKSLYYDDNEHSNKKCKYNGPCKADCFELLHSHLL